MKNNKGFTLIELLVVIAIIGLLSTLAVVSLNNARQKSRDAKRVSDMKSIQTALELYYVDNDSYPAGTASELGEGTDCTGSAACDTISSTNGIDATAAGTTYMGLIPTDPSSTGTECAHAGGDAAGCTYSYTQTGSGTGYDIYFFLEGATGDLAAGEACASENGIVSGGAACP
ncbi:MAG: prepilin-type N-terminal cleavage/methylation domain-containing protein [Patescibacteria group bacterium]